MNDSSFKDDNASNFFRDGFGGSYIGAKFKQFVVEILHFTGLNADDIMDRS